MTTYNTSQYAFNDPQQALEVIYKDFGAKLYNVCVYRWHLSEDDSIDIIYKSIFKTIKKLFQGRFENDAHLKNYLYKVCINEIRQLIRLKRSMEGYIIFVALENFDSVFVDESNETLHRNLYHCDPSESPQLKLLQLALNQLAPLQRDLLLLRVQNYSYAEIAGLLKIPNENLKEKHHRAKNLLIEILNLKNKIL